MTSARPATHRRRASTSTGSGERAPYGTPRRPWAGSPLLVPVDEWGHHARTAAPL